MPGNTGEGTPTAGKARENKLRRMAERQGLALRKSGRRDPLALSFERWMIVNPYASNAVVDGVGPTGEPSLTLDEVEEFLKTPPEDR
jgi:hypothetical protein